MSKFKYFVKKTVITGFLIWLVGTALFFMFKAMPGSFIDILVASGAGPEKIAAMEAKWGLDDPVYIQYIRYLTNIMTGDAGQSFKYGLPVTAVVSRRIFNSFILVGPAITFAYIVSSIYGLMMGNNRGGLLDRYGVIPVTVLGTIPEFFIGILLIIIFSQILGILPPSGMLSLEAQTQLGQNSPFWASYLTSSFWLHYILPFSTIVLRYMYLPSLIMRTSVVEVSGQDFMIYHRLKGLTNTTQLRHLMKHASLPVITVFPASMTRSLGGMVLVEVVFNWPGIGKLLIDSVLFRDTPVVQFVFFLVAVWVILGNYVVDLLYSVVDPRITVEGA